MDQKEIINPGDHVYVWRYGFLYQHHGIIFTSDIDGSTAVAEFYPNDGDTSQGVPQFRISSLEKFSKHSTVHKVQYSARWHSRIFHRPGTTTSSPKDNLPLILARLQFIIDNQDNIPRYHVLSSNDECICVWINTGTYCTLQVCSILTLLSIGQAKVAFISASAASIATVSVPASGIWGWLGATTTVPLLAANPFILPALIGMGVVSLVPLEMLRRFQKKWNDISMEFNDTFQQYLEENAEDVGIYELPVPPMNAFLHKLTGIEYSINNEDIDESEFENTEGKSKKEIRCADTEMIVDNLVI